jgi:alanyl aminopeptidase
VPVVLSWSDGARRHDRQVLLAGERQEVELGTPIAWLLPDGGAHGYYRWRLAAAEMAALAAAGSQLTVPERVAMLGNAEGLLDGGAISGPEFLQLLAPLASDPDPAVVGGVLDRLQRARQALVTPETSDEFAAYLRSALRPALARVGTRPVPGEPPTVARLRPRLLGWLGDSAADPEVRALAAAAVREDLAGESPLDPVLAETLLEVAAIEGDMALFDAYRRQFEEAKTPDRRSQYLSGLGSFRRPEAREAALAYVGSGPLRPDELIAIPIGATSDEPVGADRVVRWLEESFDLLAGRLPVQMLALVAYFGEGCSRERLERVSALLAAREVPGADERVQRVGDDVAACVALREREEPAVAGWLASRP